MPNALIPAAAPGLPDAHQFFPEPKRTSYLSRRAALAGVAAASLAPCSALAAGQSDDALLLQLDRELDPLYAEALAFLPQHKAAMAQAREIEDALRHLLPSRHTRADWRLRCFENFTAQRDASFQALGLDVIFAQQEAMDERIDPRRDRVLDMSATTIAGAAVKARAVAYERPGLWSDHANLDWPDLVTRNLIETILNVAGASLPSGICDEA